jgi:hypothetical protein
MTRCNEQKECWVEPVEDKFEGKKSYCQIPLSTSLKRSIPVFPLQERLLREIFFCSFQGRTFLFCTADRANLNEAGKIPLMSSKMILFFTLSSEHGGSTLRGSNN